MTSIAPENNRRTFRFKPAHDVLLLREISRQRPWTAAHGETMASWESIGQAFNAQLAVVRPSGPEIDPKACQRRYKALIDSYLSGDLASLRSTGSTDEVNEREQLIADLHQAAKDYRSDRTERRQSKSGVADHGGFDTHGSFSDGSNSGGLHSHEGAALAELTSNKRGIDQNGSAAPSGSKKPRGNFAVHGDTHLPTGVAWDFLQRYLQDETARRQQELRLAEQKLEIEKQRFELEKRERECHMTTMTAQLDLIKQLVSQLQHPQH